MSEDNKALFEILTPWGFTVRTSQAYWQQIVLKHPDLEECLESVKLALVSPEEIRRSSRDANVLLFLFYLAGERRWVMAVARHADREG